jgi:hypothetical protein
VRNLALVQKVNISRRYSWVNCLLGFPGEWKEPGVCAAGNWAALPGAKGMPTAGERWPGRVLGVRAGSGEGVGCEGGTPG